MRPDRDVLEHVSDECNDMEACEGFRVSLVVSDEAPAACGRRIAPRPSVVAARQIRALPPVISRRAARCPRLRRPLRSLRRCSLDRHRQARRCRPWHPECRQQAWLPPVDHRHRPALRVKLAGGPVYRPPCAPSTRACAWRHHSRRGYRFPAVERSVRLSMIAVVGSSLRPAARRSTARKSCASASKHPAASQRCGC